MSRDRSLTWLVTAEAVSLAGSRVTFVAVPLLELETTGSAARTGVAAFAEMLPYVSACALGGPLVDRLGPRRTSISCDVASGGAVVLVPLLHRADLLPFAVLIVVIALAGGLRGLGDTAKRALFPAAVEASAVDLTRATSIRDGSARLAEMLGAPVAGVLIAIVGAADVLLIDGASFAVTAAIVTAGVRVTGHGATGDEPYGAALRAGFAYLRSDSLILGIALMILATNFLDAAYLSVFIPVWADDVVGSPEAFGQVLGAFGFGAVAGNVVFTALATRLPRHPTFAFCFLCGGAPQMLLMATTDSQYRMMVVLFVSGLLTAPVNPIMAAVGYERIPAELQARAVGLIRAMAWAGIPLGALFGGLLAEELGLTTALLVAGGIYLAVTLVPLVRPSWRAMDAPTASSTELHVGV